MNPNNPEEKSLQNVRRLIWLYFWLLILEGALRKWALPSLSNPLLIVRDPVLLAIYFLALRARVFPMNAWVVAIGAIGLLSMAVSFIPLWPYLPPGRILLVTGYGFRSNFLHLPLIFLMGRVLRMKDVKRFGWWTLIVLVPMALLMIGQFRASPDAFLNRTAGGEGEMMIAALGKVRTAATFSFVTGVVAYFALATAYLIWAALQREVYKSWLLFAAGSSLVIGIAVSGSRSVVGACAVVSASLLAILFIRPGSINRFGQTVIITLILGLILTRIPVFKEGLNVLTTRFNEVAEATEKSVGAGLLQRIGSDFEEGFFVLSKAPFLGYGLGVGTNAGAKFLTGQSTFLLAEGEWSRIFLESGPVLGIAYVLWRIAVVIYLGLLCLAGVKAGKLLPILLFSSAFLPMISGQFGQPTILGFAVFVLGLALAALQHEFAPEAIASETPPPVRKLPRRSAYATRLHGSPSQNGQSNGADHH